MRGIILNCLGYFKICARWVPSILTPDHLMKRVGVSLELLRRYREEDNDFLNRIMTCDETRVYHTTPE